MCSMQKIIITSFIALVYNAKVLPREHQFKPYSSRLMPKSQSTAEKGKASVEIEMMKETEQIRGETFKM